MGDERADLDERAGLEQEFQALAGGEPPLGVDLGDTLGTAALERLLTAAAEFGDTLFAVQAVLPMVGCKARATLGLAPGTVKREALRAGASPGTRACR